MLERQQVVHEYDERSVFSLMVRFPWPTSPLKTYITWTLVRDFMLASVYQLKSWALWGIYIAHANAQGGVLDIQYHGSIRNSL